MSRSQSFHLITAVVMGLILSGVALFLVGVFSMGFALEEPFVVIPILLFGPLLSLVSWAVLNATARPAGSVEGETQLDSALGASPLRNLFMLFAGASLSLPLFIVVVLVENQFPGELKHDVFGPYYTHPFRPLSGCALCLIGFATGAFLYGTLKMRHFAVGLFFGSVALGLLLILAS